MIRSRALVGVLATCAALGLAGCEKPAPGVTIFSGSDSTHSEAVCWSFTEEPLDVTECAEGIATAAPDQQLQSIEVRPGATLGISVDPEVAEAGWTPTIDNQPLSSEPLTATYFRFTFPDLGFSSGQLGLQIVAGDTSQQRGIWAFVLDAVQ